MTNKHTHHLNHRVSHQQADTLIVQQIPTEGLVLATQRTESGGDAGLSHNHPLDAEGIVISRVSVRKPALQTPKRPEAGPTHIRLSEKGTERLLHKGEGVLLPPTNAHSLTFSGTSSSKRPDTGDNRYTMATPQEGRAPRDPDSSQRAFTHEKRPPRGVLQDKYAPMRVRRASLQAVTAKKDARTRRADTKSARVQKYSKRQTVQVAAWIKPALRAELETIARKNGLSLSRTIASLLEEAIRQQLHIQHAVLLQPIVEQAIARQMRSYSGRIAILLVRSLFASEQTRSLVTNILGRQQGISQPVLREILDSSGRSAKRNITNITPQLAALVEDIKAWMEKEEEALKQS